MMAAPSMPQSNDLSSQLASSQSRTSSSSHRLPTLSASQALQDLQASGPACISTGLSTLDTLLSGDESSNGETEGFERGKVTEIWGPKGAGKTALALQAAANTLKQGDSVIWLDAATPLSIPRLRSILSSDTFSKTKEKDSAFQSSAAKEGVWPQSQKDPLQNFHHLTLPSLSHLLTLLLHTPSTFTSKAQSSSLIVLDNLPTLLDQDYPRIPLPTPSTPSKKPPPQYPYANPNNPNANRNSNNQASRPQSRDLSSSYSSSSCRYAVLATIGASLRKWAALHNCAVIVTTGCATRGRGQSGFPGLGGFSGGGGPGAVLVPGVGGSEEWEVAVAARVIVFRDFGLREGASFGRGRRVAGVLKGKGLQTARNPGALGSGEVGVALCGFEIAEDGVVCEEGGNNDDGGGGGEGGGEGRQGVSSEAAAASSFAKIVPVSSPVKSRKRVHEEIADSEEDDDVDEYGWHEGDADAIAAQGLIDDGPLEPGIEGDEADIQREGVGETDAQREPEEREGRKEDVITIEDG